MIKLKVGIAGAVLVAGLVTPLVLQHQSLTKLRDDWYADKHQGQLPTNFDLAASLLPDEAKGQTNLSPDQFEILYQGSLNDVTNGNNVIVIREREAWQTLDGGWARAYGFADGHSEIHKADEGNFGP